MLTGTCAWRESLRGVGIVVSEYVDAQSKAKKTAIRLGQIGKTSNWVRLGKHKLSHDEGAKKEAVKTRSTD